MTRVRLPRKPEVLCFRTHCPRSNTKTIHGDKTHNNIIMIIIITRPDATASTRLYCAFISFLLTSRMPSLFRIHNSQPAAPMSLRPFSLDLRPPLAHAVWAFLLSRVHPLLAQNACQIRKGQAPLPHLSQRRGQREDGPQTRFFPQARRAELRHMSVRFVSARSALLCYEPCWSASWCAAWALLCPGRCSSGEVAHPSARCTPCACSDLLDVFFSEHFARC